MDEQEIDRVIADLISNSHFTAAHIIANMRDALREILECFEPRGFPFDAPELARRGLRAEAK